MAGRIVFCGVGALGSAATMLCRNLDAELVFVDFDRVESKNLLSQVYVKPSVGKNKVEALKLQLANFHGVKAEAFGVRLTRDNTATPSSPAPSRISTPGERARTPWSASPASPNRYICGTWPSPARDPNPLAKRARLTPER